MNYLALLSRILSSLELGKGELAYAAKKKFLAVWFTKFPQI